MHNLYAIYSSRREEKGDSVKKFDSTIEIFSLTERMKACDYLNFTKRIIKDGLWL